MPKKLTFAQILESAAIKGGVCLSAPADYTNSYSRLLWCCARGHEWESPVANVRAGYWCKRCSNRMPDFEALQAKAAERGGKCLSRATDYVNAATKLTWQCVKGHVWRTGWANVSSGKWCSECAGISKPVFSQFVSAAEQCGGECLSAPGDYSNRHTKLRWRCAEGHEWLTNWGHVQRGQWCPTCAGNKPASFEQVQAKAGSRGGRCLSEPHEYKNMKSKLRWQCENGHAPWLSAWANIKQGHWCPACTNRAEGLVRRFLEICLDMDLPHGRPEWLKTNRSLRGYVLDGYNEARALAFEYHGRQHFESVPRFHRSGSRSFDEQQARDTHVRELCIAAGVTLVEIPCFPTPISIDELVEHCLPFAEAVAGSIDPERIALFKAEPVGTGALELMQAAAAAKGGECLASQYLGAPNRYAFRCKEGHEWEATWHDVRRGTWCAVCSRRVKPSLADLQNKAAERGGQCLARPGEYRSNKVPIAWRCAQGHEWHARWNNISNGGWCPECSGRKPRNSENSPQNQSLIQRHPVAGLTAVGTP